MTAPLFTSSKLVLATAIACALLAGCNKHNDANTAPAATPATTPGSGSNGTSTPDSTPPATPSTTPGAVNPDGTTTPPNSTPGTGTGTGTSTPPPPPQSGS